MCIYVYVYVLRMYVYIYIYIYIYIHIYTCITEVFLVLEGSGTLTSLDGTVHPWRAGDVVVLPKGHYIITYCINCTIVHYPILYYICIYICVYIYIYMYIYVCVYTGWSGRWDVHQPIRKIWAVVRAPGRTTTH